MQFSSFIDCNKWQSNSCGSNELLQEQSSQWFFLHLWKIQPITKSIWVQCLYKVFLSQLGLPWWGNKDDIYKVISLLCGCGHARERQCASSWFRSQERWSLLDSTFHCWWFQATLKKSDFSLLEKSPRNNAQGLEYVCNNAQPKTSGRPVWNNPCKLER